MKGKTVGIDSTTLEANAAMKSIVRRDCQESYTDYLKRLAQAEGVEAEDAAAVRRMDRKRAKKMPNEEWVNPHDPEAEITRLKDGRTALAYKAEQAVDMESGAIVAVTTHGGAAADTESIGETVAEAGVAVAEQVVERAVNEFGIEEVVADKGYHSNEVMRELAEWGEPRPRAASESAAGFAKTRTEPSRCSRRPPALFVLARPARGTGIRSG